MKKNKSEIFEAMEAVLADYKNNTHKCDLTCPLCKHYFVLTLKGCPNCPMAVFRSSKGSLPCLYRKCEPITCSPVNQNLSELKKTKLKAVMEFYEKAIEIVKTMTYKEINKRNAFKFLIDIDNEVAEKHQITKILLEL
jgi:hypothetical protein